MYKQQLIVGVVFYWSTKEWSEMLMARFVNDKNLC